jgi:hypothetical protein
MGTLCEINMFSGSMDAAFITSALTRGGRRVYDFWLPSKFLGNFRKKYSYSKSSKRKEWLKNRINKIDIICHEK